MQKNIANFLTLLGCLGLGFTLTKTSYASIIVFNFAEIKNIQKSDYDSTLSKTLFAESRQKQNSQQLHKDYLHGIFFLKQPLSHKSTTTASVYASGIQTC